ncbi:MAG: hypothetical protein K2W95_13165 [Candidatus Obscuribacterales bacterium]|nr:hypothetical protein [Candidatus Obscuribacterales bacterium]
MKNFTWKRIASLGVVLLTAPGLWLPPAFADLEPVQPTFDGRTWKQGFTQETPQEGQRITEWILQNESVENWSELITDFFFKLPANAVPEKVVHGYFNSMNATGKVNSVISSAPTEVIYEFRAGSGDTQEFGIHRIFMGKSGLHNVQHATKNAADFEKSKDAWVKQLKQFKVK